MPFHRYFHTLVNTVGGLVANYSSGFADVGQAVAHIVGSKVALHGIHACPKCIITHKSVVLFQPFRLCLRSADHWRIWSSWIRAEIIFLSPIFALNPSLRRALEALPQLRSMSDGRNNFRSETTCFRQSSPSWRNVSATNC